MTGGEVDSEVEREGAVDLATVLREIDEEVAHLRSSGAIPPGLERELDETFARFSPPAATGGDGASLLAAAERSAFVDVDVPTGSGLPGGPVVKKALRKGMAWYLRYLAQQASAFNAAAVEVLRSVDGRLTDLEAHSAMAGPDLAAALAGRATTDVATTDVRTDVRADGADAALAALAVSACAQAEGRVLVANAGEGALVRALVDEGVDAYGVEPRRPAANRALASGLDVRVVEVADHLGGVAAGVLGGVVLTGVVDAAPPLASLALAEAAAEALAPGASLVLHSTSPAGWERAVDPVTADLSAGRPLHLETWRWGLARAGLEVDDVHLGPPTGELSDVPDDVPGAASLNANNAALRAALFGPGSYTVVAHRPR